MQTVKVVLFNQWLIGTPLFVISYYIKKMTNTIPDVNELPPLQRVLVDLAVMIVVDEIGLYYVHRLQHHPKLYAAVHKKHHEWPAPIAITFVYSTPAEYLMNAIPVTLVRQWSCLAFDGFSLLNCYYYFYKLLLIYRAHSLWIRT